MHAAVAWILAILLGATVTGCGKRTAGGGIPPAAAAELGDGGLMTKDASQPIPGIILYTSSSMTYGSRTVGVDGAGKVVKEKELFRALPALPPTELADDAARMLFTSYGSAVTDLGHLPARAPRRVAVPIEAHRLVSFWLHDGGFAGSESWSRWFHVVVDRDTGESDVQTSEALEHALAADDATLTNRLDAAALHALIVDVRPALVPALRRELGSGAPATSQRARLLGWALASARSASCAQLQPRVGKCTAYTSATAADVAACAKVGGNWTTDACPLERALGSCSVSGRTVVYYWVGDTPPAQANNHTAAIVECGEIGGLLRLLSEPPALPAAHD